MAAAAALWWMVRGARYAIWDEFSHWGRAVKAVHAMDGFLVKSQDDYVRRPLWWRVAAGLQVLLAAAAAVGLVWLAAYWVAGLVKIVLPEPPYWGPIAVPTTLLAGGLLFGWLFKRWGRVMPMIVAHALIDSVAFIGYALLAGKVSWLPG